MRIMDRISMKSALLWFILLQMISKFAVVADVSSCGVRDGSNLQVNLRSHVNASDYRVSAARLQTSSKITREQIFVDLIQSEQVVNKTKVVIFDITTAVPAFTFNTEGYEYFPGLGRYKLYTTALTWPEAKKKCEDDDAHLIVIETAAEVEVVKTFFARKPLFTGSSDGTYVSIGADDVEVEGHLVTVTGKDFNSLEYKTLSLNGGRSQNYMCIDEKGVIGDFPNDWRLGYICEGY